ncbi:nucleotidyl transferase AbiEii/AbiGii toxin family protein [Mesorhizobium sp. M0152]
MPWRAGRRQNFEFVRGFCKLIQYQVSSLSKGYGLIQCFSEDIDVTVFRADLDEAASVEELEELSNKKHRARLDDIRDACRA